MGNRKIFCPKELGGVGSGGCDRLHGFAARLTPMYSCDNTTLSQHETNYVCLSENTQLLMYIRTSRAVYAKVGYVQLHVAELTILSLPCRVCKPDCEICVSHCCKMQARPTHLHSTTEGFTPLFDPPLLLVST
jgi:hypothetical protein